MSLAARLRRLVASESGYTVFELLTVLAIFGTVTAALTQLFVSATTAEISSNRRFQAQQHARIALDKLRRDAHCASSASIVSGGTGVVLNLPSQCKGTPQQTWCTVSVAGVTQRYRLFRKTGATCDATGSTRHADYLTQAVVFAYFTPTPEVLGKLKVTLPVNIRPAETEERYSLEDELTLRNSARAA